MHCSSASSPSPAFASRDYLKCRAHLSSPKFVKLGRFVEKNRRRGLSMDCSSSASNGTGFSTERVQQQVEGSKDAVMIVDHGSRRQESNLMLNEFVKMFKARTSYQIVEPSHMELAEPTIKDAFAKCVEHGATRVIDYSGVSYVITAPLGLHELLVDVMSDRIKHCVSHVAGVAAECDVCAGTGRCRLYP